jgi:hypothetical protein
VPGVRVEDSGADRSLILARERAYREAARALMYEVLNVDRRTREVVQEVMGQTGNLPLEEGLFEDAYCATLAELLWRAAEEYRELVRRRLDMEGARTRRSPDWQSDEAALADLDARR